MHERRRRAGARSKDKESQCRLYCIVEVNALFQGEAMASATQPTTQLPSAQEWKEVLEQILPPQGEWTEEEYLVLTDHRNRLVEFTDGFLEVLPMPTDKHQGILGFLYLAFFNFIEPQGGKVRFSPLRLRIRPGKFREPIFFFYFRRPIRAGKTGSGSAPTSLWKLLAKRNRNGIWLTSGGTMPRPMSQNTGSSTRKRKPSPSSAWAGMLMKKLASTGVGNRRHRCCCRIFQSLSRRFSTRIESRVSGVGERRWCFWTSGCWARRRTRWSVATVATARCRRRYTGFGRSGRSRAGWRWTCCASSTPKAGPR